MALDAKNFILSDWPVIELVKRGFQEDFSDSGSYSKCIGDFTLHVDVGFDLVTRLMSGDCYVWIVQKLGESRSHPWRGVIKNELVPKAVDYLTEVLEGYSTNPQFNTLLNNTLKEIQQESLDPKDFIMSNDWVVDGLEALGFKPLGSNNQYWAKRLKNGFTGKIGAIVVWLGAGQKHAHVSMEVLLNSWTARDPEYVKLWEQYTPCLYVARLVEVLEATFLDIRDDRCFEYERFGMFLGPHLRVKFGKEHRQIFDVDLREGLDAKDFIMTRGGFFPAFRARLEELGWNYEGVKKIPTDYGNTVDEHWFSFTREPLRFSSDQAAITYTLNVVEIDRDGVQRLEAYADCTTMQFVTDNLGATIELPIDWQTETHIQPDNMSGEDFADLVDEEITASTGP